jgi:hypothetical protein
MKAWVRIKDDFELGRFVKMNQAFSVLSEFAAWIRGQVKYGDTDMISAEAVKEKFWEICNEEGVDPYED